jgi:hypothetical protein
MTATRSCSARWICSADASQAKPAGIPGGFFRCPGSVYTMGNTHMDNVERYSGEIAPHTESPLRIPKYGEGEDEAMDAAALSTPEGKASSRVQSLLGKMIVAQFAPQHGYDAATHRLRLRPESAQTAGLEAYGVFAMAPDGATYVRLGRLDVPAGADDALLNTRLRQALLTGGR